MSEIVQYNRKDESFCHPAWYVIKMSVVCVNRDRLKVEKALTSLGIKVMTRDLRHSDPKILLYGICSQWLPVSSAVLCILLLSKHLLLAVFFIFYLSLPHLIISKVL
ncbi:hypothetical protein ILYODFUR_036972 [Ilyodon furcidens]|uniref:Uncharacterized protein n=1 Tax=Ilyodon furcidens TaxID=33524 RepID=A0ABV0U1I1_9TELE